LPRIQPRRRHGQRLDGGGEAETVHEAEDEAHQPSLRRRVAPQEILEGDPDDGRGDRGLDDAAWNRDDARTSRRGS